MSVYELGKYVYLESKWICVFVRVNMHEDIYNNVVGPTT
jgi:hypothetical protein